MLHLKGLNVVLRAEPVTKKVQQPIKLRSLLIPASIVESTERYMSSGTNSHEMGTLYEKRDRLGHRGALQHSTRLVTLGAILDGEQWIN